MGNYQEYLKRMPNPLRELESAPVRQHMFGNPFKIDKRMIIDEADIDLIGQGSKPTKKENSAAAPPIIQSTPVPVLTRGQKRRAGPLPKDFRFTPYKNRRRHRGMMEEESTSDSESSYSSAPSSPMMTPPASPSPQGFNDKENENSVGMNLVESFNSDDSDNGSDNDLIIDESPQDNEPMSFGSMSLFNNRNDMNDDIETEDRGGNGASDDRYQPPTSSYDMNGGTTNDFITTKPSNSQSTNNSPPHSLLHLIKPPPEKNGMTTTLTLPLPPIVQGPDSNHLNHFTNTNHVGINKIKKVKSPSNTIQKAAASPESRISNQLDDESTWQKNLDLRINLHKEIRRPVLRKRSCLTFITFASYFLIPFFVFFRSGPLFISIVQCFRVI